jgi:hypothetical protein
LHDNVDECPDAWGLRKENVMRRLLILTFVIALGAMVVQAAAAVDAGPMSGTLVGGTVGFNPDPGAVEARCPTGSQWILSTVASVDMESDIYTGTLWATNDHCSRWVHAPRGTGDETLPGKIADGKMIMTTPGGDTLVLATRGTFVFRGDTVTFSSFTSDVRIVFDIVDGTGIFEGATGHGTIRMVDLGSELSGSFVGSLAIVD